MIIKVENCNNIKEYRMEIQKQKLNIKYGINGTGKSTVSNAIQNSIISNLDVFKPFNSSAIPSITYEKESLKSVLIYDEKYIDKYLFISKENIHSNTFEVFVKVDDYDSKISTINEKLNKIKENINLNEKITELIEIYDKIDKEIKTTKKNELANSGVIKSLSNGNKIINIPDDIKQYSPFLKSNKKIQWYAWYNSGFEFYTDHCPFCTTEQQKLHSQKDIIDNLFVKSDVAHISVTDELIDKLSKFIDDGKLKLLKSTINSHEKISEDSKKELLEFKLEFTKICNSFLFLKNLSYLSISELDDIGKALTDSKLDTKLLKFFISDEMREILENIGNSIDEVKNNIKDIEIETSKLNTKIKDYTKKNENRINEFLKSVGMNYEVEITREAITLKYINSDIIVEPMGHLSWGERNCFALALFLFDCLAKKPDLIILDDPVSSFDSNKKYGIMHYLFKGERTLKDKTVLLFSHDIEPIINFYKKDKNSPNNVVAYCLSNHNNIIEEKVITKSKLCSVIDQCKNIAADSSVNIVSRLISCRRLFELQKDYECSYNIISSLFHNKSKICKLNGQELTEKEIKIGLSKVKAYIKDFDYNSLQESFKNLEKMKDNYYNAKSNYEKIEIFRILNRYFSLNGSDNNIMKFINETYHIENSFLYQLDQYEYDCVPNYIIVACNEILKKSD